MTFTWNRLADTLVQLCSATWCEVASPTTICLPLLVSLGVRPGDMWVLVEMLEGQ